MTHFSSIISTVSMRHVHRLDEGVFYEHVKKCYGKEYPKDLAQSVMSVDLGKYFKSYKTNSFKTFERPINEQAEGDQVGAEDELGYA